MKLVRASRAKGPANRNEAWACATANAALPGSGSLAAGKSVGYYQLALAAVGLIVSTVAGIQMLIWVSANYSTAFSPTGDPSETLDLMWREIRWPLAGLVIAAVAWLWSAVTSAQILAAHPKNPVPPRIV